MNIRLNLPLAAFFALLLLAGCKEADRHSDCTQVCERYNDCVNSASDVDNCVDACEDIADDSEARDGLLDDCENCLDDKSCTEATVPCALECALFVR